MRIANLLRPGAIMDVASSVDSMALVTNRKYLAHLGVMAREPDAVHTRRLHEFMSTAVQPPPGSDYASPWDLLRSWIQSRWTI